VSRIDDFSAKVKKNLSDRAGRRCSNPACLRHTSGPKLGAPEGMNIGVAAHISAAQPLGPRHDESLSSDERRSIDNAIWLCETCAHIVDVDENMYTNETLKSWKERREGEAIEEMHSPQSLSGVKQDEELIRFYAQCLDRPVFLKKAHMASGFDIAIRDTITALNTGCLLSTTGTVLARASGKTFLRNPKWRATMNAIVELLYESRAKIEEARKTNRIRRAFPQERTSAAFCTVTDSSVLDFLNAKRDQVYELFSTVAVEANVTPPSPSRAL
jgi:hypothetical protein